MGETLSESSAKPARLMIAVNYFVVVIMLLGASGWAVSKIDNNVPKIASVYPVAAVDFLEETQLDKSRIYNSYNWGGYLIWRGVPVFVDGRADVYWDEFLHYYRQTLDMHPSWREPLQDHRVTVVLMEKDDPLNTLLLESGEWQELYQDDVAQVLGKVINTHAD